MAFRQKTKAKQGCGAGVNVIKGVILTLSLAVSLAYADTPKQYFNTLKENSRNFLAPKSNENFNKASVQELSNFQVDTSAIPELPMVTRFDPNLPNGVNNVPSINRLSFNEAIMRAVQRNPDISQTIASLASQNANIDVAKAAYFPQISGGLGTGDLTSGERGRQVVSLNVTQMLYDFGKVKSSVDVQQAQLFAEQANVLVSIDDVAYQAASAIVQIKRYQEVTKIAEQQVAGITRINEIANLRAKAGISSQADPVQAQSYLEASRSNMIVQQTQLRQYQQKLRTLLGFDVAGLNWTLPERLIVDSNLYQEPEFNQVPKMMLAQAQIEVAKAEIEQTRLSNYPTLNVKGSLSQAVNGRNPNNNKDDGFYNSIMVEATSNFYQGGATASRTKAASYAEQAARARMNTEYLNVLDQVRVLREEIENKQRQMTVLMARKETATRTKELYQEQYKLGTRTVVDLLNAEQSIHSASQEIESARYDIYSAIVNYIAQTGRSRDLYDLNNISIQGFEVQ
jgi:outer membrane protein, adhesin transport system